MINEPEIIETNIKNTYAKINSCGLSGVHAYHIEIEVNVSGGLPNFILVGLPDAAINESKERVKLAIQASSFEFPNRKIIVNLAPANTKKAGPTYDLPIAIGILATYQGNLLDKNILDKLFIVGELGLSGIIRSVSGVLSFVIHAKKLGAKGVIIPYANVKEASLIEEINIYPVSNLSEAINVINNFNNTIPFKEKVDSNTNKTFSIDFSEVKGQSLAKRALEISASGGHHVLMTGSPGSGKSMLAERLNTIIPQLTYEEKIETTQIYSVSGKLNNDKGLITHRPFRTPHHNISAAGLIGGGSIPQPGEISLAHNGVLFLDELTEFQRQVLDSLRQAIEKKEVTISRSRKSYTFPCDFTLIAACNPCPCGYYGDPVKKCTCTASNIKKYQNRISGPLLDRIDLQIEMKRLTDTELLENVQSDTSAKIKQRVETARKIQKKRYKEITKILNSELSGKEITKFCNINKTGILILKEAIKSFALTARSYDRLLKVSRTIADLENSDTIKDEHILEALQFRLNNSLK